MLVSNWMSKPVITVDANDSMHDAIKLLKENHVRILPVMEKDPITVPPDFSVEKTAQILLKHKISAVPVVDSRDRVVGVITQTDLFRVQTTLTGVDKKGSNYYLYDRSTNKNNGFLLW